MTVEVPVYVLDSYALLSHFQDESGSGRVVDLLEQAHEGKCRLMLSVINLGEVCYLIERRRGLPAVHIVLAALQTLPIELIPADQDAVLAAAHLKANYPIAYADAFAAASARDHSATLVTGDPEFQTLEKVIQIEWLPQGERK